MGSEATSLKFEGYLGDTCVVTKRKGQVMAPKFIVTADAYTLCEDTTYDTTRIIVRLVDDWGNNIIYANDAFIVEVDGVLEVIGPKNMALIGGSIGFWVKSTGLYGKAEVGIYSERFGHHTINVDVRKE